MKRLFFVYQLILHLLGLPVLFLWPLLALKLRRIRPFWAERLGFWGEVPKGAVWLHGASFGEIRAITPLVEALKNEGTPIIITSLSDTGRVEAARLAGENGAARMIPIDFFWSLAAAFINARPKALVVAETELWPGFLLTAHFFGVPMILVSGRISDKTFASYLKMRSVTGKILSVYKEIHAQSEKDAERFRQLGAPSSIVRAGGNMKFDACAPVEKTAETIHLQGARERGYKIIVAGSTHPTEAAIIAAGAKKLRESGVKAALAVAPRHLEKLDAALGELKAAGFGAMLLSTLGENAGEKILQGFGRGDALVIDKMGILNKLYSAADLAFVGGSLVPVGGHSILEPICAGTPVLFGPHMQNAIEIKAEAMNLGLAFEISSPESFAQRAFDLLNNPVAIEKMAETSSEFITANKGAVGRAMAFLKGI